METEVKPNALHENGAKVEESTTEPPDESKPKEIEENMKTPKSKPTTRARSRSRTPQKFKSSKNEENKAKKEEKKLSTPISKKSDEDINGHNERKTRRSENLKKDEKKSAEKLKKSEVPENDPANEEESAPSKKKITEKPKKPDSSNNDEEQHSPPKKKVAEKPKKPEHSNNDEEQHSPSKKKVIEKPKVLDNSNKDIDGDKKDTLKEEKVEKVKQTPEKPTKKKEKPDETKKLVEAIEAEEPVKHNDSLKSDGECVDMDPLIIGTDEPDPELQFDETSDLESGKGSPVLARCKTRRSHTRNIPTPKTPKSIDSDSEKNSVPATPDLPDIDTAKLENLNDTNDSVNVEDVSTCAEVGSDVTRLEYIAQDVSISSEHQSYLNSIRESSFRVSPRRSIRPLNDSYRLRAFKNNQTRSDLNLEESMDRVAGVKRKKSLTPEDRKKFKADSPGITSYLSGIKSRFRVEGRSSTPKLTGYKDESKNIHEEDNFDDDDEDKKGRCSVM